MDTLIAKIKQIRWNRLNKAAPIFLIVSIFYFCWKLASLFWLVIAPPQAIQVSPVSLGSQQIPIPNITSFALFSEMNSGADQNLDIILQGVVVGSTNQLSSAVLKVGEVSENYRVGDTVESTSYQLAEVYWDKVILLNSSGGRREVKFKGIENGLYQPMIPENSNGSTQSEDSENRTEHNINRAIEGLQQNKDEYLQNIGVSASSQGGYEITEHASSALTSKLRLQTGDQVLSLNGQTLADKSEAELLELAKRAGQVKLEVKRGDQVITIQQSIR
ncbi:general secretion pathway protein [Acinetobacter sp. ANC 4558]|uniref:type II secretion system protein N n=1 Tax=Acinetobacter sp. ANC 4558 TaxID=1977876 RepID=UPI000A33033C|nr:type II secretion system protein N [Acinetobacter sp. ANC 4558]OTG81203.1 general secretion pathway protein [Acinetobacter sp. ANC 4558]